MKKMLKINKRKNSKIKHSILSSFLFKINNLNAQNKNMRDHKAPIETKSRPTIFINNGDAYIFEIFQSNQFFRSFFSIEIC